MELKHDEYGEKKIVGYLYKDVKNKVYIKELMARYPNNLAICNAELILSLKHMLIALHRAIYNYTYYKMKTEKLSTEIIYHLAPHNAIKEALEHFGAVNANHMLFIWIDVDESKRVAEMAKVEGTDIGLENLSDISNLKVIFQMFGVSAKERAMENGGIDAVYNRIALKNI